MNEEIKNVLSPDQPPQLGSGVHVLGIRHHGPGSAKAVRDYLEALKPDIVLVEGPPEADSILEWVGNEALKPPVAILCYQPDNPKRSVFYPFAEFSPEWQAILFARQHSIPVKFFDLPIAYQFALGDSDEKTPADPAEEVTEEVRQDPIAYLAEAAGYEDGEQWWERMFEYRRYDEQVFEAVNEAMQSLREHLPQKEDKREALREAHMRKMIRQAQRELYTTIAVVCGAWHAPALIHMPKQKEDDALLKGLTKLKTECTWIPWTYSRLSYFSGYGAGIASPGWYEHIWQYPEDDGTRWMSKIASLFRSKGMDTSVAHVIEAVRLAESLAALRGFSRSGLEELNEATLSVLCHGEPVLMQLIRDELTVSNRLGTVPADTPKPPLQLDIEKQQKSLRLPATADFKDYTLDLRKDTDLARSVLLHRLNLLDIQWGRPVASSGKGTFKEQWRLQWEPEFSIEIIDKGSWGNTVLEAAENFLIDQAQKIQSIRQIAEKLEETLPAGLHQAVDVLIQQLNNLSAASGDVMQLVQAVPPLVNVTRYGNVRKTDATLVRQIVHSMITRICIGLPNAVIGIQDDAAQDLLEAVTRVNEAISLLQDQELDIQWLQALHQIAYYNNGSPLLSGYATRLLMDRKALDDDALVKLFYYRMSAAAPPAQTASWLEGFLKSGGAVLLIDHTLWNLIHQWVTALSKEQFTDILPLLRRTFAAFTPPEKRRLGEKVRSGDNGGHSNLTAAADFDKDRGVRGIPIMLHLFGLTKPATE